MEINKEITLNLLNKDIRKLIRATPHTSRNSAKALLAKLRYYSAFIPFFNRNTKNIRETITTNSTFTWSEKAQEDLYFIRWIFIDIYQKHISERNRHG